MAKRKTLKKSANTSVLSPTSSGFRLLDIRLLTTAARQPLIAAGKKLPSVKQVLKVEFGNPEGEPNILVVVLTLSIADPKRAEDGFLIHAKYGLRFLRDDREFTEDEVATLGKIVAVHMIWPYWREHVQSMTFKMNLPPLTIPVVNSAFLRFEEMQTQRELAVARTRKST